MAIPRFIHAQASHDSEIGAKAIEVANAEQRKQGQFGISLASMPRRTLSAPRPKKPLVSKAV
jgi:hypothetical protein